MDNCSHKKNTLYMHMLLMRICGYKFDYELQEYEFYFDL